MPNSASSKSQYKPITKIFPVKHADTQLTTPLARQWMDASAEAGMTWRESRLSTAFMSGLTASTRLHLSVNPFPETR